MESTKSYILYLTSIAFIVYAIENDILLFITLQLSIGIFTLLTLIFKLNTTISAITIMIVCYGLSLLITRNNMVIDTAVIIANIYIVIKLYNKGE